MDDSTGLPSSEELLSSSWPSIAEFYSHKNVFITGGTGFVGKCLLEKFLRCIPEVGKIYVLVRPKKNKDMHQRLEELSQEKVRTIALPLALTMHFVI